MFIRIITLNIPQMYKNNIVETRNECNVILKLFYIISYIMNK